MADVITPGKTVTFTITSAPQRVPQRKTLARLMRMQPDIRRELKMVARRRRQKDNVPTRRSGRIWVNRAKATRLVRVEPGQSFTLTVTPQIVADLQSVRGFLDAKATS
jgi:hypothetical protein